MWLLKNTRDLDVLVIANFYVLYYPGSCGSFLTTLLCKLFCFPVAANNISKKSDCHDLGNGTHQSTNHVRQSGWAWADHLVESRFCISGHYNDLHKIKKFHPNITVIFIDVEPRDINTMINCRFEKTWNPLLRPVEYDKFVKKFDITHWPDKQSVINDPKIIKQSFQDYDKLWYQEWLDEIDQILIDVKISYHSLMGMRGQPLHEVLIQKLGVAADEDTKNFIQEYQMVNARYTIT